MTRRTLAQGLLGAAFGLAALVLASGAFAQISPGKLSGVHQHLEGPRNCLTCHQAGKGVSPDKCLSCHEILASRIDGDMGLHANPDYGDCKTCHIEHHGRDFELVWWGKQGREVFDHALTGYALEGAHSRLQCEQCHGSALITNPDELTAQKKDLERTFLGLDSACLACHQDEHRGQVAKDSCSTCHGAEQWNPAPLFDHAKVRFPLRGRHRNVACDSCHARAKDPSTADGSTYLQFAVAAFKRCTDCHRDAHDGRLGTDCERCHSPAGWEQFNRVEFDHDGTRFALGGAHKEVACNKCHAVGTGFKVERFGRCADCHGDSHWGQFTDRPDGGLCESCHTMERFQPATFTIKTHAETDYPLEGAHLATPCVACHRREPFAEVVPLPVETASREPLPDSVIRFRFESTACSACHQDPHQGDVERWRERDACQTCHVVSSFREMVFDHLLTGYALSGRHAEITCQKCHPEAESESGPGRLRMLGASSACVACHDDPHFGQLDKPEGPPRCEDCHGFIEWKELLFDHSRDSRYPLEGEHLRVSCDGCHRIETGVDGAFVRYKPLGMKCEDCHSASVEDLG